MGSDDPSLDSPPLSAAEEGESAWSSGFLSRSRSATPRSRPSSPRASSSSSLYPPSPVRSTRFSGGGGMRRGVGSGAVWRAVASAVEAMWGMRPARQRQLRTAQWVRRRRRGWVRWRTRGVTTWAAVVVFFFVMNWWMFSRLQDPSVQQKVPVTANTNSSSIRGGWINQGRDGRVHKLMFTRLLALAAHALADICNAVAVARLLNSTLVIPSFLYSSVWKDKSQFSDIYQEDHFISYLKPDIRIVKELPVELSSLDLEAIGSLVTDTEVMKESKPSVYVKKILPILRKNRVVHFIGFGNRLAFDPIPFELQRLRCRCNFHALQFVHKIQETGALLVQRMHHHALPLGPLINNLLGPYGVKSHTSKRKTQKTVSRYLAVHLRFEIDMAAYSLCYFGGGKDEEEELEAYRAVHFPALTLLRKTMKIPSAASLRSEGRCPLTPEEAVLMLAALGFKRKTSIYVAGANIYGGKSRMAAFKSLYPNLSTKESLLSSSEIEPFLNVSSQLAALDFIVCAAADAFAMTDSGSQFSSLVSGFRMYYGGGRSPTIRPNKRRLSSIFSKNSTIEWREFEKRVRKANKESKVIQERPIARSVYRHPRSSECMCKIE